jgi:hypothetical protein
VALDACLCTQLLSFAQQPVRAIHLYFSRIPSPQLHGLTICQMCPSPEHCIFEYNSISIASSDVPWMYEDNDVMWLIFPQLDQLIGEDLVADKDIAIL